MERRQVVTSLSRQSFLNYNSGKHLGPTRGPVFIIHGVYHFWPKRVAFRNDYCLTCQVPTRSIAIRTFDVGHIFWIPILPVGFWKHWQCGRCDSEPHTSPTTPPFFKWAGLCILFFFSLLSWAEPVKPPDAWISWLFRTGSPLAGLLLFVHLLRLPKQPSLRVSLRSIPPANDMVCPFCDTPLLAGPRWSCPQCGAVRY